MVSIVVAQAKNGVIGINNDLPWYLPDDLKHFKAITNGHTVVMGRKTFESIVSRLGKPLPNRKNIVITRDKSYAAEGATVVHSVEEARKVGGEDIFIIGGAEIYNSALPFTDKMYVTEINAEINGDVYFPPIGSDGWTETMREHHPQDDKHAFAFDWVILERKT
jgi:dihydrofolate reductase